MAFTTVYTKAEPLVNERSVGACGLIEQSIEFAYAGEAYRIERYQADNAHGAARFEQICKIISVQELGDRDTENGVEMAWITKSEVVLDSSGELAVIDGESLLSDLCEEIRKLIVKVWL